MKYSNDSLANLKKFEDVEASCTQIKLAFSGTFYQVLWYQGAFDHW